MTEESKKTGTTAASKTTKAKSAKSTAPRKTAGTTSKKTSTRSTASKSGAASKKPAQKSAAASGSGETVTIDGKQYPLAALSDNAKSQITNLRATDRIIEDLEAELAISRTARASYAKELEKELASINATTIQ